MTAPPRLTETMRAEGGAVALLDLHLARLARSADALGYALDADAVRRAVEHAAVWAGRGGGEAAQIVRLTLGRGGDAEVETRPLDGRPLRLAWIDPEPLAEAGTALCQHKTTARAHYRARFDRALARGADEAVLVNAAGLVTEGTRTTVWAERGGRLLTPPLAAGGLAGVFRAHVLATDPRAAEADLTPDDLRNADRVLLTNAARGWMPVRLLPAPPGDGRGTG
ncbi:aminotransferase class IV [Rubrivirga sp. S365]|uniref:aminotransferase class IV n=1 Tax=Rubrivirga sp. S365 TaxID=3076080 RepID=UPI0028CAD619|nr:aminotransferase class IV [Rubrivirga sp. S365]MDT7857719.1 aminotransferase class IV [Rubrivirga sp. S365]